MEPHNNPPDNNLSHIPSNRYFQPPSKILGYSGKENRKNIIKKYYGRKITFVQKRTNLTAAINRSKYFLHFKIDSLVIHCSSFKSLANLVIFNTDIIFKYHIVVLRWRYTGHFYPNIHPFQLRKALRSCKNPKPESAQLKHLQDLFHLKSLTLHMTNGSSMSKASKIIRKLRFLRSLHLKYLSDYDDSNPNIPIKLKGKSIISDADDKKGWGFFYKISKLPRLQRFVLQTSLRTLQGQSSMIQQEFVELYQRSHSFNIDIAVYGSSSLDIPDLTAQSLITILKTADSLSIHLGIAKPVKKNPYTCQDFKKTELSEQENKKILKQGKRPVKFYVLYKEKRQVNIGCLLAKCENLMALYLKISGIEAVWDQDYESFPQKLQILVLDVDFLGLKYETVNEGGPSRYKNEEEIYQVSKQRKVKFHSGLLELLKQLKTRAIGLETFTLFMCLAKFKESWYQPKSFKELVEKIVEEKAKEFFEELESFEKLHRIDLCKKAGDLDQCLNRVLAAKNLKMINMRSCCNNL